MAMLGTVTWFLGHVGAATNCSRRHRLTASSYTYYMIVVMPGIYVAVIHLVTLGWRLGPYAGCGY